MGDGDWARLHEENAMLREQLETIRQHPRVDDLLRLREQFATVLSERNQAQRERDEAEARVTTLERIGRLVADAFERDQHADMPHGNCACALCMFMDELRAAISPAPTAAPCKHPLEDAFDCGACDPLAKAAAAPPTKGDDE